MVASGSKFQISQYSNKQWEHALLDLKINKNSMKFWGKEDSMFNNLIETDVKATAHDTMNIRLNKIPHPCVLKKYKR